jgi:hypothetical protein
MEGEWIEDNHKHIRGKAVGIVKKREINSITDITRRNGRPTLFPIFATTFTCVSGYLTCHAWRTTPTGAPSCQLWNASTLTTSSSSAAAAAAIPVRYRQIIVESDRFLDDRFVDCGGQESISAVRWRVKESGGEIKCRHRKANRKGLLQEIDQDSKTKQTRFPPYGSWPPGRCLLLRPTSTRWRAVGKVFGFPKAISF